MIKTSEFEEKSKKRAVIVPLPEVILFPGLGTRILVCKEIGQILEEILKNTVSIHPIGLTIRADGPDDIADELIFPTGNLLDILAIQQVEDGYMVDLQATCRVRTETFFKDNGVLCATYLPLSDLQDIDSITYSEILDEIKNIIHKISSNFQGSDQFTRPVDQMERIDQIIAFTLPLIPVSLEEKQALLEIDSLRQRYLSFLRVLTEFHEKISIRREVTRKVSEKITISNREAVLREQLKAIQEELNEIEGGGFGDTGYRDKILQSSMPEEVKNKALSELKKMESGGNQNHETPVIRNYLDLLLSLPWNVGEKKGIDLESTRKKLEENHYGLNKVKERIIQHLAVMKLKEEKQGSIILLAGPPGTGKTSLGKSIADALERKYVRISLGGVKDEAEIRGHRRTYVGALPGRIIQGMKRAGEKNPVFVLDEIDKLSTSYAGDPASALLEVLDPEQNNSFSDHYLEVPYDLSDVFFIATANSLASIPAPLLDRMELIEIPGYTRHEAVSIGKKHLVPRTLEEHGLNDRKLMIDDKALSLIIEKYTREAGVRGLKRQLDRISRYASEKIVSGKSDIPVIVTEELIPSILGKEIFRHESARAVLVPGVVTGLAWTPFGGDILFIEGTFMPGTGKLTLTGQLGDVMKESANISMSLIRSRFAGISRTVDLMTSDVHIHVPSGATPKDGPSAGVTLFTALVSLFTGTTVDPRLAMTGEVTLSGAVLPVGGIREKILAAHRAGITRIILPRENAPDLEEIPDDVRQELTFEPVGTIEEVLKIALNIDLPSPFLVCNGDHRVNTPTL